MPSRSQAQHNAMAAAAFGKSKLGIPKATAREFIAADKATGGFKSKPPSLKRKGRKIPRGVAGQLDAKLKARRGY